MPYEWYKKETGNYESGTWYDNQYGYKLKPFNKNQLRPTDYYRKSGFLIENNYEGKGVGWPAWARETPEISLWDVHKKLAYNKAYGRFKDLTYDQAAILSAIAERTTTIEMVASRMLQIANGATQLASGDFKGFCKTFGIKPLPKHANKKWARPKQFGSLWLEYWMGWAPTIGDIYAGLGVLGEIAPPYLVRAVATSRYDKTNIQTSGWGNAYSRTRNIGKVKVGIQAKIKVTNPLLFQLEELGLVNPISTVWEVTPFSWLLGWVVNAESILASVTDFMGLELVDLQVSETSHNLNEYFCYNFNPGISYSGPSDLYRTVKSFESTRSIKADGTLRSPYLTFALPNGLSKTRGATAISLLVNLFGPDSAKKKYRI